MKLRGRGCLRRKAGTTLPESHPDAWEALKVPNEAREAHEAGRLVIGGREFVLFQGEDGTEWAMNALLIPATDGGPSNEDREQERIRGLPRERMTCPACHKPHFDEGIWAIRPHNTHRCVDDAAGKGCGAEWRLDYEAFGVS